MGFTPLTSTREEHVNQTRDSRSLNGAKTTAIYVYIVLNQAINNK